MAADSLTTQGARASAVMELTYISQNIPVSAPEGLDGIMKDWHELRRLYLISSFPGYIILYIFIWPVVAQYSDRPGMVRLTHLSAKKWLSWTAWTFPQNMPRDMSFSEVIEHIQSIVSGAASVPWCDYYSDAIISTMASQITGFSIACSTICSSADQRKHQSSAPLAFVRGIHRSPVDSSGKDPWREKYFYLMASS